MQDGGNRLLAGLDPKDFARLAPLLEETRLDRRQVLYEPNAAIARVYFPHDGLTSMLTVLEDGTSIETAMVGPEGMIGLPVIGGHLLSPNRAVVQAAGRAASIGSAEFADLLPQCAGLRELLGRYLHAFLAQLSQTVACNAMHSADKRLARWLLAAADRTDGKPVLLTHEFLAEMLGLGRPTISIVARTLQNDGLISYRRGLIEIADRPGLERAACECYRVVKRAYQRLLPLSYR
jgi:CRP-like cAMP-binding protein